MTLVEFLLARVDQDEAWARRNFHGTAHRGWHPHPAVVLAECEAKRTIIGRHHNDGGACGNDGFAFPCPTLRHIAASYTDHPDYRAEWRP